MAIADAISDPFRRQLLATTMQSAAGGGAPDPTAAPSGGSGGNSAVPGNVDTSPNLSVPQELDISGVTSGIKSEAESIRQQGYLQNAAQQKTRGILQSGETARLDQQTSEQARLQAEGQLATATTQLLTLRQNERLAKLGSITQLANTEQQGANTIGGIQAQGVVNTKDIQTQGIENRATQDPALKSSEVIASGQQATAVKVADIGAASNKVVADIQKDIATSGYASSQTVAKIQATAAQDVATTGVIGANTIESIRQSVAAAGNTSAEVIAKANNLSQESIAKIQQSIATGTNLSNQTIAGINKEIAVANNVSQQVIAKWDAVQKSFGYDITTPDGATAFKTYITSTQLSASDQKDIVKMQVAASAQGYDLSTDKGRTDYQTHLTTMASTYQLSAADQKSIQVANIAQGAHGFDLTDANQRLGYSNYLNANADKFNLTAADTMQLASNQLSEDFNKFTISNASDWDKFLSNLDQASQQFNVTQDNQMAIVRAQLSSNVSIANSGINTKMIEDMVDLLNNPVASQAFTTGQLKEMVDRYMGTAFTVDPITKTPVPVSATTTVNGVSPAMKAKELTVGALQDVTKSRAIFAGYQKAFNTVTGQSGFDSKFDFNSDGKVNMDDFYVMQPFINVG